MSLIRNTGTQGNTNNALGILVYKYHTGAIHNNGVIFSNFRRKIFRSQCLKKLARIRKRKLTRTIRIRVHKISVTLPHIADIMLYYRSVSYLIAEDVGMVLEDGDDKLDGLHRHVELLVEGHRHNPVLELGGEQLQLVLKELTKISLLIHEPTLRNLTC